MRKIFASCLYARHRGSHTCTIEYVVLIRVYKILVCTYECEVYFHG